MMGNAPDEPLDIETGSSGQSLGLVIHILITLNQWKVLLGNGQYDVSLGPFHPHLK